MADDLYNPDVLGSDVPFVPEQIAAPYQPRPASAYTSAGAPAPQRDDEMQGILRGMLKQSQTDVQGALTSDKAAEQQYLDSQAWKRKTLQDSYDKLVAQKKNPSEFLLAFGAGMLKPTKTGSFFESLGNAGEAGVPALGRMNTLEQANKKTGLEYQLGMAGVDTDMAKYRSDGAFKRATLSQKQGDNAVSMMDRIAAREQTQQLARERLDLQRDNIDLRRTQGDDRLAATAVRTAQPLSPAGKQALDEGFEPGTQDFVDRVSEIGKAPTLAPGEKKEAELAAARENKRLEAAPKVEGAYKMLMSKQSTVDTAIDDALGKISGWSTGYGEILQNFPKTEARTLRNLLSTIKANIGFDYLGEMRANSQTGAALGAVSDVEMKLLQAVQGALDQGDDPENLKKNLLGIKKLYADMLAEKKAAFERDYGDLENKAVEPGTGAITIRRKP